MTNVKNKLENMMNEPHEGNYLSSIIHENLDVPNVVLLEVNRPTPSDGFGHGEGSILSGDVPLSNFTKGSTIKSSRKYGEMNSDNLHTRDMTILLSFSINSYMDLNVAT